MAAEKKGAMIALSLVLISLAVRAFFFLSPTYYAEENISVAMSLAIEAGARPYSDFFHGHPPVHLFLLSVFNQVSGLEPILSAKLLSLLISILLVLFVWKIGGPFSAAIFSWTFPFFYWFSLSLPLPPLSLMLLALFFSWTRGARLAAIILFSLCAFLSEFSAAAFIFPLVFLFSSEPIGKRLKLAGLLALAFASALLLLSALSSGQFFSQAILSQARGRLASNHSGIAGNIGQSLSWVLVYVLPLLALSIFSGEKRAFALSIIPGALLLLALPGISNNTLQFAIPFLAISAGGFRKPASLPGIAIALSLLSIFLLSRAGLFSPSTPGLEGLVSAAAGAHSPGGEIWGTPEATIVSVKTGIPVAGKMFDTTPFSVAEQGPPPQPEFLVISAYYYDSRIYGGLEGYSPVFSSNEPLVGELRLYRRKNLKTGG